MERIYLDNNATTALDPLVFKAMLQDFSGPPANPSSVHYFGQRARGLLAQARQKTSLFFGVKPEEVIFTSGGTESVHLMMQSLKQKGHLITTAIEHSCVYKTAKLLEAHGWTVDYLPCGFWGAPTAEQIQAAIRPDTLAMIFSASNGETGVKIDLEEIADLAKAHQIPLLIDAVAFIGKEPLQLPDGVSALALSGHKFHGPKGTGALIARSSFKIQPQLLGGSQEFQKRAGTENLAGILGLSEALSIFKEKELEIFDYISSLRLHMEKSLISTIADVQINGEGPRISNTTNAAFLGVEGKTLLMHL
ncbi:MAG: cysteine desulfurase, partial [Chlamydiae bacterium]|nr:cysteine desulfurase [Chlamydiota bacterium]